MERIRAIKGVEAVLPLSIASASIDGRTLDVAAVDPAHVPAVHPRRDPPGADFVWKRLAGGEVVVDNDVDSKLIGKDDMIQLGSREDSPDGARRRLRAAHQPSRRAHRRSRPSSRSS